ncbi:MFS transporter, partial [Candidatus Micrarchaeota archaeon]|nr:MFS transporter [Candidatus Micrarchaeota archaeon]
MNSSKSSLPLINFLYSFIAASLSVIVPLYLLDKKIDPGFIGIIIAINSVVFLIARLAFAAISDKIGTKTIAFIYAIANPISIFFYSFTPSLLGFSLGSFSEGIRSSGFWAIARTEPLSDSNHKSSHSNKLSFLSGIRQFADGFGRILIGMVIAYFSFENAYLLLFVVSMLLIVIVLSNKNKMHFPKFNKETFKSLFQKQSSEFWISSLMIALLFAPYDVLIGFILPLYTKSQLNFSYSEVGLYLAVFSIVSGVSTGIASRFNLSNQKLLLLTAFTIPLLFILPMLEAYSVLILFPLSIFVGASIALAENLLGVILSSSKAPSTDAALLNSPGRVLEILLFSTGGFLISLYGYSVLFYLSAL